MIEVAPKQRNRSFSVFCSLADDSTLNPEEESKDSVEVSIELGFNGVCVSVFYH